MISLNKIIEATTLQIMAYIELQYPDCQTDYNNYWYIENKNSPMLLIAHIDTVRQQERIRVKRKGMIINNPYGVLGADDRAGVYGLLWLDNKCQQLQIERPNILFTNYEETGGVGISTFIEKKVSDMEHVCFGIELDRCDNNDWVTYRYELPTELKEYVESYNYKESWGSYSDIADIMEDLQIPCVNLSIGYDHEHTSMETLNVGAMYATLWRVLEMLQNPITTRYKLQDKLCYYGRYSYSRNDYNGYGYGYDYMDSYRDLRHANNLYNDRTGSVNGFYDDDGCWNTFDYRNKIEKNYSAEDRAIMLWDIFATTQCPVCDEYGEECCCGWIAEEVVKDCSFSELLLIMPEITYGTPVYEKLQETIQSECDGNVGRRDI